MTDNYAHIAPVRRGARSGAAKGQPMPSALTIAGADPTGWAGAQADLAAFSSFGVTGLSAITALTAQDREKVSAVLPVPPLFLARQISSVASLNVRAVKIGMLATEANAKAVAAALRRHGFGGVVWDPVFASSGGFPLLDNKGVAYASRHLTRLSSVVTPNLSEAAVITGVPVIGDIEGMRAAALGIHALGGRCVLIKGGHLRGAPVDLLYDGRGFHYLEGRRVRVGPGRTHGTGCMLSAALAACLAKGLDVKAAALGAKRYVERELSGRGRLD